MVPPPSAAVNGPEATSTTTARFTSGVADHEHAMYEVRRNLATLAEQQNRPLTEPEQAIDRELTRRSTILYQEAFDQATGR